MRASIATPNHWHALSAIWAMKAGKDVYGEKPACYNIYEGMRMIQVQRESKRIMQVDLSIGAGRSRSRRSRRSNKV